MRVMISSLAIVVVTFNRCRLLERTLRGLCAGSFPGCSITVIDNCSTDDTREVVRAFIQRGEKITYICNRVNVGACANVMRAYEYADGEYTWIVCDDDEIDSTALRSLATVLVQSYDIVRVADVGVQSFRGAETTLAEVLNERGSSALHAFGFLPGVVFRTRATRRFISFGYEHIWTRYPHLFVLLKAMPLSARVFTLQKPIVSRGVGEATGIGFEIYGYWWAGVAALPTQRAKRTASSYLNRTFGLRWLFRAVYADIRQNRPNRDVIENWRQVFRYVPSLRAKTWLIIVMPITCVRYTWLRYILKDILRRPFEEGTFTLRNAARELTSSEGESV